MLSSLLDFLFPRRSLTGDGGAWITEEELRQLRTRPVILDTAALRAQKLEWIDGLVAVADYDAVPLLHRAVHTLKYKKVKEVGNELGRLLAEASVLVAPGVLCPVPLHWIRKFSRGFNQSELLAREVGEARGWEVKNLLRRNRWTGSQVGRRRKERLIGVRNAFMVREGMTMPDHVILIDDLSTTGATLNECAKILKNSGVKKVEGLVIALG